MIKYVFGHIGGMAHTALPTSIRLGPIEYTVRLQHMDDLGQFNCHKSEIIINEDAEYQQKVLALFHEITHAILYEAGLQEYENEVLVNVVSAGIVTLLRHNPEIIKHVKLPKK